MAKDFFSVPVFFIVFRATLEAAIIISVLLGLVEVIARPKSSAAVEPEDRAPRGHLIRRIFLGAVVGLLIALGISAAFIAVWYTKDADLWAKSGYLWEGIFSLLASIMIFAISITTLWMDRNKAKWHVKLTQAFQTKQNVIKSQLVGLLLFILPFIAVLREATEAVVYIGGVALGQPATSIPIAAIIGLLCGLLCGLVIYLIARRSTLKVFLVVTTNFVLLFGAGLFSNAVSKFEQQAFNTLVGSDVDANGATGPGTYRVQGNVWYLNCCSPENKLSNQGWMFFNAILGWTNNATRECTLELVGLIKEVPELVEEATKKEEKRSSSPHLQNMGVGSTDPGTRHDLGRVFPMGGDFAASLFTTKLPSTSVAERRTLTIMPKRDINTEPCTVCGAVIRHKADIPRHRRTHLEDKSALTFQCVYPGCQFKSLQKSNLKPHMRTHTGEKPLACPEPDCEFRTADPGSLIRHRKALHGYAPNGARKAKAAVSNNKFRRSSTYTRAAPIAPLPSDFEIPGEILEALDFASPKVVSDTPQDNGLSYTQEKDLSTGPCSSKMSWKSSAPFSAYPSADIQQLDLNTTACGFDPLDTFFAQGTFTGLSVECTLPEMSFSASYNSAPPPTSSSFSSSLSLVPSLLFSEFSSSNISSASSSQHEVYF
ncbi:hypothetical protein H0H81_011176 [Sphagnurus paluster]|uniref:C2H2-type domain-containing protein n=1 Tax=Sphagnurus paluster TaxID=117069 RepID=A0A9P7KJH7_9AGAR|nr:hypothetical protein H0H81_011176 [Sphagnurus paluster]